MHWFKNSMNKEPYDDDEHDYLQPVPDVNDASASPYTTKPPVPARRPNSPPAAQPDWPPTCSTPPNIQYALFSTVAFVCLAKFAMKLDSLHRCRLNC